MRSLKAISFIIAASLFVIAARTTMRLRKCYTAIVWCLFFGLFWLSVPGTLQAGEAYYPLKEGKTLTYQLSGETRSGGGQLKLTITNLAPRDLKGKRVVPQHARGEQGQSEFQFLVEDAEGIAEVATQKSQDIEPKLTTPPNYVIKFPVKPGNQWEVKEETSFLSEKLPLTVRSFFEGFQTLW